MFNYCQLQTGGFSTNQSRQKNQTRAVLLLMETPHNKMPPR